jgi:hypothetical protein
MKTLIYILASTWFFTHFEPIKNVIDNLWVDIRSKLLQKPQGILFHSLDIIYRVITCWQCLAFWVTLTVTFNAFEAFIVSLIAWFIHAIVNRD